jgi:hypothetical protein
MFKDPSAKTGMAQNILFCVQSVSPQPLGEFGGGGGVFAASITENMTYGPPSPPPIGGGLGGLAVELEVSFVTQA